MAKTKEIGLEHIIKLNISAAREPRGIYNEFARKYGQNRAREIMENIYGAGEKDGQQVIYDKKNAEYDVAMIFSGCYDADIIRKACNWVYEHREVFGDRILEVGCDCGFMTTFLGSIFPDKKIVAIDRNQLGINIAKKNVEKFGLTNVEFMCVDVCQLEDVRFDTIFSMRTLQENGISEEKEDLSLEIVEQADKFKVEKQDYANELTELLDEEGKIVSIERVSRDALFLGWIKAFSETNMKLDTNTHAQLKCLEVGEESYFQAMVFEKGIVSEVECFGHFLECCSHCMDLSLPQYSGWDAKIMYEYTCGEVIKRYVIEDTKTGVKNKVVCCVHAHDDSCILYYQNNNGNVELAYYDISQKNDLLKAIADGLKQAENLEYIQIHEDEF